MSETGLEIIQPLNPDDAQDLNAATEIVPDTQIPVVEDPVDVQNQIEEARAVIENAEPENKEVENGKTQEQLELEAKMTDVVKKAIFLNDYKKELKEKVVEVADKKVLTASDGSKFASWRNNYQSAINQVRQLEGNYNELVIKLAKLGEQAPSFEDAQRLFKEKGDLSLDLDQFEIDENLPINDVARVKRERRKKQESFAEKILESDQASPDYAMRLRQMIMDMQALDLQIVAGEMLEDYKNKFKDMESLKDQVDALKEKLFNASPGQEQAEAEAELVEKQKEYDGAVKITQDAFLKMQEKSDQVRVEKNIPGENSDFVEVTAKAAYETAKISINHGAKMGVDVAAKTLGGGLFGGAIIGGGIYKAIEIPVVATWRTIKVVGKMFWDIGANLAEGNWEMGSGKGKSFSDYFDRYYKTLKPEEQKESKK